LTACNLRRSVQRSKQFAWILRRAMSRLIEPVNPA
jgi:hypothetical protein